MANPPNLNYCKIVGNFKAFVADFNDPDDLPDFVAMEGTGEIYPNVDVAKNTAAGQKSTYFSAPIRVTLDGDGDLSQGGRKYVMVLAPSPDITPQGFTYTIRMDLTVPVTKEKKTFGPYSFNVTPGGEINLADIVPVAASAGVPVTQGPKGDPGDLVSVSTQDWSGAVTLDQFPQMYISSLTGSVSALSLPTSPTNLQSGTITLVVTQDATGGRTIDWPDDLKWAEGVEQQPSAAPNSTSVFPILWTGVEWLALTAGKNFS